MKSPVSEVVVPNNFVLKEVDPATRLIDALEMMKQGLKRLLVPKSIGWRGVSKRFSVLYNGKWLKNLDGSDANLADSAACMRGSSSSSTTTIQNKFCSFSKEDMIRFLIGCLGALAPLPLASISSLGAITQTTLMSKHPDLLLTPPKSFLRIALHWFLRNQHLMVNINHW